MPLPTSRAPGPDPQQLEVEAEEELVGIQPQADLEDLEESADSLIWGELGNFDPGVVTYVPIWLAILLAGRRRCKIIMPEWMTEQRLEVTLAREQENQTDFEPLPYYYYEISQALLTVEDRPGDRLIGATPKVSRLLREIRKQRIEKLSRGLKDLEAAHTVRLPGVAAREFFVLRAIFLSSLAMFEHFDQLEKSLIAEGATIGEEQTPSTLGGTGTSGY